MDGEDHVAKGTGRSIKEREEGGNMGSGGWKGFVYEEEAINQDVGLNYRPVIGTKMRWRKAIE